jgi:hypothetical protein
VEDTSMTVLTPRKPFESKESVITVDDLPVGPHLIRLVVVDDEGNASDPFDVTVTVTERGLRVPLDTLRTRDVGGRIRVKPKPKRGDQP